jgi:segregation and condensation protein A
MPSEATTDTLILSLDGFEGPLDLLLDLARVQKVDLARISIVALVDQYLAIIEGAQKIRLELAADWLVMAAWLAWLKSRLLLPAQTEGAAEGAEAADILAARLAELERMRAGAAFLSARPQLKHDVFARGTSEDLTETDRSSLSVDMPALLRGYMDSIRRVARQRVYTPRQMALNFWTVQDAMQRLSATLGRMPEWSSLEQYLPGSLSGQQHRAAMASTLLASLEMARGGGIRLRQDSPFSPILISGGAANEA